jgi:RimJ/RimL family protein N-acetyltransferase
MQSLITTERLTIKPLTENDSNFVLELVNTKGWLKYIGNRNVNSKEDALGYIKKIIDNPDISYWVVRLKHNDVSIGIVSLVKRDYLLYPDIGFAFLPSFSRNGYAYEATKAVLNCLIHTGEYSQILGTTIPENIPSITLLKKLGFQFQKQVQVENEILHVYDVSTDKLQISQITASFFSAFSNINNSQPNLDLLNEICIPEASIVNLSSLEPYMYDLTSFIEPRKKILTDGSLKDFEEKEIFEKTKIISNMAHRNSKYEKSGTRDGKRFKQKGSKLFQFIKIDYSWKIKSVIWRDEVFQLINK